VTSKRRRATKRRRIENCPPERLERFAKVLANQGCYVEYPGDLQDGNERDMGAEYIASIAEQRPRTSGHGYPGGISDWDQPEVLWHTWRGIRTKSIILPDWMGLPLLRRLVNRLKDEASRDKSDESHPVS